MSSWPTDLLLEPPSHLPARTSSLRLGLEELMLLRAALGGTSHGLVWLIYSYLGLY